MYNELAEASQTTGVGAQIVLAVFIILASTYFVSAETALVALRGSRLNQLEAQRNPRDRWLLRLTRNPSEWLGAVQIAITVINFVGGAGVIAVIAPVIAPFFEKLVTGYGLAISYAFVTILMTYFIIIFGELVPKMLAIVYPERISRFCAPFLVFFIWVTYPFIWLISVSTLFFSRPFTKGKVHQSEVTEQEIEHMIMLHNEIPTFEKQLASRIFMFGDTLAHEIMTPRTDMAALPITATLSDLKRVAKDTGHSRFPVYDGDVDNIKGIVMLKDAFFDGACGEDAPITNWIREDVSFVPETLPILKLYREMNLSQKQIAVVIDEHGGTAGVVTVEDIVEEVFGEIEDEHDGLSAMWEVQPDGNIVCDGMTAVRHLNLELELGLPEGEHYETVAGLIMDRLGFIPKGGEKIVLDTAQIDVVHMKGNRIVRVKITRL